MKKKLFISIICFCSLLLAGCTENTQIANPWSDCNDNLTQAAKIAGFKFPLLLSNYTVRAMKDMIEITYPLDEFREVTVRKSLTNETGDISGDYNKYPKNETIIIKGGVPIEIRGDKDKIYVMNMSAYTGYYSARCEKGMSLKEVEGIYEVLREAEDEKLPPEAFESN